MARILVVDDEPLNRELIEAYLEGSGHAVLQAHTGEQALEQAAKATPDLVLLDVMLPGIDGYETTRRLRAVPGNLHVPIILLTSLSDRSSKLQGLQSGANEFLTKPVDREELLIRAGHLLALRAKDVALLEKNVALAEADRFRTEMTGLLVHDLKNPLAVIMANLSYIADALSKAEPSYREALSDTQMATARMNRLITELHELASLEENRLRLRRAPADLGKLITEVAAPRRQLANAKQIKIEVEASVAPPLSLDADLFLRVLENIADNSLRYTPPGGRLRLEAREAAGGAELRVANTGTPIPPELRTVIFEKFGQATPGATRTNLGLGLYFCRLAVEAHGGKIWVEEAPPFATSFVIRLPRQPTA